MSIQIKTRLAFLYFFLAYLLVSVGCSNSNWETNIAETQQSPKATPTPQNKIPTLEDSFTNTPFETEIAVPPSATQSSNLPSSIAYITFGTPNILGVLDNSSQINLIQGCIFCDSISWSPTGKQIAFNASFKVGDESQIYIVTIENGKVNQVTSDAHGKFGISWSPDGQSLIYAEEGDPTVLVQIGLDGKVIKKFLGSGYETYPAWSPDGNYIAFLSRTERSSEYSELWLMDKNGKNRRRLTDAIVGFNTISWSPNSAKILFVTNNDCGQLAMIDTDGGDFKEFVEIPGCVENPSWSPDGKLLMFIGSKSRATPLNSPTDWQIYIMSSDGNNIVQISEKLSGRPIISVWGPLEK